MPAWNLLTGPAQFLPHSILIGPFFQASPLATQYNPPESQLIISTLHMETAHFSKTLASTNQSTQHLNPKDNHQNHHPHENLKPHIKCFVFIDSMPSKTISATYM
jgi:hypothetical protein